MFHSKNLLYKYHKQNNTVWCIFVLFVYIDFCLVLLNLDGEHLPTVSSYQNKRVTCPSWWASQPLTQGQETHDPEQGSGGRPGGRCAFQSTAEIKTAPSLLCQWPSKDKMCWKCLISSIGSWGLPWEFVMIKSRLKALRACVSDRVKTC